MEGDESQCVTHADVICSATLSPASGKESTFVQHPLYKVYGKDQPRDDPDLKGVWCFHCCHPFEGQPWVTDDGIFCSMSCHKGFLLEHPNYQHQVNLMKMVTTSASTVAAPPRAALKVFGGYLDIEEFRKMCTVAQIKTHRRPCITQAMVFESTPLGHAAAELAPQPSKWLSAPGKTTKIAGKQGSAARYQQLNPLFSEYAKTFDTEGKKGKTSSLTTADTSSGKGLLGSFVRKKAPKTGQKKTGPTENEIGE